jgi:prevent-host-death family protein
LRGNLFAHAQAVKRAPWGLQKIDLAWPGLVRYFIRTERSKMKMREDIRPVTYLKSKAADLLAQLNKTRRPVIITQNGEARAVIQDPESYERTKAAVGLMKLLVQGEEAVRLRKTHDQEHLFQNLAKRLLSRKTARAKRAKI